MNSVRGRGVWASVVGLVGVVGTVQVRAQVVAPLLDHEGQSITAYLATSKTPVQDLRPHSVQRGVDYDGTLRGVTPFGMSIAADPLGGGSSGWRRLGDVDLTTVSYAPSEIDLSFPTLGPPVLIGRTYGKWQQDYATGNRFNSNGIMGVNWSQLAQPEMVMHDADGDPETISENDFLYLVLGADRYVELRRVDKDSQTFKAKNGAAGVAVVTPDGERGDQIVYTDARGVQYTFFGFNTGVASGQLWTIVDVASHPTQPHTVTVNDSDWSSALSDYQNHGGRIQNITDASGRVYSFTYSNVGGVARLTQVNAVDGNKTVGTVDYTFYTTNEAGRGQTGDLKMVTISLPATSGVLEKRKYYRYYDSAWQNAPSGRGHNRLIKMVVGFEGVRAFGAAGLDTASDQTLLPFSDAYFEYPQTLIRGAELSSATFNGDCGCASGSTSGAFTFTYQESSSYATNRGNAVYNPAWATRTIIQQPDNRYVTRYFDEVGQAMADVMTSQHPSAGTGNRWVSELFRNTSGWVTEVRSPAANLSYTHSTGAIQAHTNAGLITTYGRIATGNLAGLRTSMAVKEGSAGISTTISAMTLTERQLSVGDSGVSMPNVTASTSYPSTGTGLTTTVNTTFWVTGPFDTDPGVLRPKIAEAIAPAVSTGNNGPGTTTSTLSYFRRDGSLAFTRDATGVLNYSRRDAQGRADLQIADVKSPGTEVTDTLSDWGLTLPANGIHVVTERGYDDQGRVVTSTAPSANGSQRTSAVAYVVQGNGKVATLSFPRSVSGVLHGPVSINVSNHAGRATRTALIRIDNPSTSIPGTSPDPNTWSQLVEHTYDDSGTKLLSSKAVNVIGGTAGDVTTYSYDAMGRKVAVQDPTGTIRETKYDDRGRPIETSIGTNNTLGTNGLPAGGNNMVVTSMTEYDGNASGGNSLVTKRVQDADGNWGNASDQRVTQLHYDWRGRMITQINPVPPHSAMLYDNLGRVVAQGQFSAATGPINPTSTGGRVAFTESVYDERGQVARSTVHEVDQGTGALGDSITTNNWYDAAGRLVKSSGQQIRKVQYDRLGRTVGQATLATSATSSYADSLVIGTGDIVLEEAWMGLEPKSGKVLVQHTVERKHDATPSLGGSLSASQAALTVSGTAANGRVQISAMWYDAWDRVEYSAQLGTNGGATFDRSAVSVPAASNTMLVNRTKYDGFGRVNETIDVAGIVTRTEFDARGRQTHTIQNYVDGTPGGGVNNDQDRVTEYAYPNPNQRIVTRKMPNAADDQITTYNYGVLPGAGNQVAAGHLLKEVIYPPQSVAPQPLQPASERTMTYAYNALGEVIRTQDLAGNVIATSYDLGGRVTARAINTFAPDFDTRVEAVNQSYTARGQLAAAWQSNGATVLDETTFVYDGWGNPTSMVQDPDSSITGGSGRAAFTTNWTWEKNTAVGGWQNLLMTKAEQPGGLEMWREMNTFDSTIGRVSQWLDENKNPLTSYTYMGTGTVVGVVLDEPNLRWRSYDAAGSLDGHVDRFNRPLKHQWSRDLIGPVQPTFVDLQMQSTNRYGQIEVLRDNVLATGQADPNDPLVRRFDAVSVFDALRRVSRREEGELDTSGQIAVLSRQQEIVRSLLGVVTTDKVDLNGDGVFTDPPPESDNGEMDDSSRVFNRRNELRSRTVVDSTGTNTYTLTYDRNGNLTSDGQKYDYVYNPFGQLVQVREYGTTDIAANYTYNALGHRNSEQTDTNDPSNSGIADGQVDTHDPVFFIATDQSGRRVATYRELDADPKERFAYHQPSGSGIGGNGAASGPILRTRVDGLYDRPEYWATEPGNATHVERFYYTADHRGSVVAIVSSGGNLMEQYRYSPTGVPFGIARGDVNSSGAVEGGSGEIDYEQAKYIGGSSQYHVRSDWDLDGDVDTTDLLIVEAHDGIETGRRLNSAPSLSIETATPEYKDVPTSPSLAPPPPFDPVLDEPAIPFMETGNYECIRRQPVLGGCGWPTRYGYPWSSGYSEELLITHYWPHAFSANRIMFEIDARATGSSLNVNVKISASEAVVGLWPSSDRISLASAFGISCGLHGWPTRRGPTLGLDPTRGRSGLARGEIVVTWSNPDQYTLAASISVEASLLSGGGVDVKPWGVGPTLTGREQDASYPLGECVWACVCCQWRYRNREGEWVATQSYCR